MVHFEQGKNHR